MTKQELRSLIKNSLQKLDKTNKYHPNVIDFEIEKVLNEMYWELYAVDPLILQRYVKTYTVAAPMALYENSSGLYYTTLPADIVPFPDKCSGVRRIATAVQSGLTFVPIDAREMDLIMSSSYINNVNSKIGYAVTNRIEYYNMSAGVAAAGARMDLIIPFSSYADAETVLLPEISGQDSTFIKRVIDNMALIKPVDFLDDNKDNTK